MKKKKVLLYWFEIPGRQELLDIFVYADSALEFVHLYHNSESDRDEKYSPYQMVYWFDYASPFSLLKSVRPDIVVVANGDGLHEAALLVAANRFGIRTYCMQHGIVAPSIWEEIRTTKLKRKINRSYYYCKVVQFYFCLLLRLPLAQKKQVVSFFKDYILKGNFTACRLNRFPLRLPSAYICFTKSNAQYFIERDGAVEDRIIEIGVPFFDHIFKAKEALNGKADEPPYALFIDTVLIKGGFPVGEEVMNGYYHQLNALAKSKGLRLKIKLHPWAYQNSALLIDSNIEYIRAVEKNELSRQIKNAWIVFSFFSTLVFPALFLNPRIVAVEFDDFYFPSDMKGPGKLPVIDVSDETGKGNAAIEETTVSPLFLAEIENRYLYKADGRSKNRLREVLEGERVS